MPHSACTPTCAPLCGAALTPPPPRTCPHMPYTSMVHAPGVACQEDHVMSAHGRTGHASAEIKHGAWPRAHFTIRDVASARAAIPYTTRDVGGAHARIPCLRDVARAQAAAPLPVRDVASARVTAPFPIRDEAGLRTAAPYQITDVAGCEARATCGM